MFDWAEGLLTNAAFWTGLYVVLEWTARGVALLVVPLRRSPSAASAWLLLILFLPVAGVPLYLALGEATFTKDRRRRFARLGDLLGPTLERVAAESSSSTPETSLASDAASLCQALGHQPPVGNNAVELLTDYDGSVDRLVSDIDAASVSIYLLYYIFADDATGSRVIDALARAVARGVDCRVLYDAVGSKAWSKSLARKLDEAKVASHPLLPTNLLGRLRGRSARADLRNHRKIAVIDGRIGYTGSQNLVDAKFKPAITYEELVARVVGRAARQLELVFASDWFLETGEVVPLPPQPIGIDESGDATLQVLASGPDFGNAGFHELFVFLAHRAERRLFVTTPYLIPDESVLQAFETAVRRGVDVRLIVPAKADQGFVGLAQRSFYGELLSIGVRLHRYRPRFLHAKHFSVDGEVAVVGTSNMDIRSFRLNAEVSLLALTTPAAEAVEREQRRFLQHADELTAEAWARRPRWRRPLEGLARLLSPLL